MATKKAFHMYLIILLPLFFVSLTTPVISYAQSSEDTSIISSLTAYENALSSSNMQPDQKISNLVLSLIEERKAFYQKYFSLGLHSELTDIDPHFDRESIIDKGEGGFKVVEFVTLTGIPKLQIASDYPVYKAALLAINQAKDNKVINSLEKYAKEILEGVQASIDEGEFSITIINMHSIKFDITTGQILTDEFSSKSIDDAATDQVIIENGKALRIEPDLTLMPDYQIYIKPVEQLTGELLNSLSIDNEQQQSIPISQESMSSRAGYNGSSAASYIRTWVAVTSLNCGTPSSPVYQDRSKWNPAYSQYSCADCANYVSQALRFGGMVTTSTWQPYTTAWINVPALNNYIISHDLGYFSSCSLLGLGDLGIIPNTHVVMVSGLNPLRYSAHTSDRKNYAWQSSLTTCINVY